MRSNLDTRRARYFKLSTTLSQVDTPTLATLLRKRDGTQIWGGNQVHQLCGARVFVKTFPITALQYEHMYSTRNLYQLPAYYNYGVGSAGFGPFREIVTHIKTTNWVLEGAIENFPLMYHYRILPTSFEDPGLGKKQLDKYIRYWNGSKNLRRYIEDRAKAKYEVCLFLEYIPNTLAPWLRRNLNKAPMVVDQMKNVLSFLRQQGVVHFDSHHGNILTDGKKLFLTDFGLVCDESFELSNRERVLLRENRYYDCGVFLSDFIDYAWDRLDSLPAKTKSDLKSEYGLDDETRSSAAWTTTLLPNLEEICANRWIKLPATYLDLVARHRDAILAMREFFELMWGNNRKNYRYDRPRLRRSLLKAGFIGA